jgi:hypothetical protein
MNLNMLNRLSTEALLKLREGVDVVLVTRLDTSLKVGCLADFIHANGETITISIERINGKTVSGTEIGASVKPGRRWRVTKGAIKVRPSERKESEPVRFAQTDKPQTDAGAAW